MSKYLSNLKILEKTNHKLAKKIEKVQIKKFKLVKIDGEYNIFDIEKKKYLYNEKNAKKNVAYDMKKLEIKASKIAIFLGFGLSYEYNEFINNYVNRYKTEMMIIIEKEIEIFKICMQIMDLEMFFTNKRIKYFVGEEPNSLYPILFDWLLKTNGYYFTKSIAFVYSYKYLESNLEYYKKNIKMIREVITNVILRFGDSADDSIRGERNMFKNLEHIIKNPGINMLYDQFKDTPAIIASTGPSLNKNKHLLKDMKGKALIFCPEASLRILHKMDVSPNFITSLERDEFTTELIQGYEQEYIENVYLAATPVIVKETYDAYEGPKLIVYRNYDHFKWLELDKGMLDIKLSAGNMAFKVAAAMGCNPIILIGQDLAFSRDGKTHAKGMDFGEDQSHTASDYNDRKFVKANYGDDIETTEIWHRFLKGYEVDISEFKGKCINATEGGAYIEGTEVDTLINVYENYIKNRKIRDFNQIIKHKLISFTSNNIYDDYTHIVSKMDKAINDLQHIIGFYSEIVRMITENEILLNIELVKERDKELENLFVKYRKIENKVIEEYHDTLQLLVMHVIQSQYIQYQNDLNYLNSYYSDKNVFYVKSLIKTKEFYLNYIKVLEIIIRMLLEEKEELINRKSEFEV